MSLIIKKNTTFKIPRTGSGGALLGLPASFTMVVTPSDVENLAGVWIKETGNFAYAWPFNFYYRTNTSRLFETSSYGMYGYINNNWEFRGWDEEYSELFTNTAPLAQASTNQTSVPTTQVLLHGVGNRAMTNS